MLSLKDHASTLRRAGVLPIAALALIAGLSLAGVPHEAGAATQAECITAFSNSEASGSCELDSASASGDNCTLRGLCRNNGGWSRTSITVNIDSVDDLQNCSGSLATSC